MKHSFLPGAGSLALLISSLAHAQTAQMAQPVLPQTIAPPAGQRLGAWITQHVPGLASFSDLPATLWLAKDQVPVQAQEKAQVLAELRQLAGPHTSALADALAQLPVTGRKRLAIQDPWLMQTHPHLEPIAQEGDRFVYVTPAQHVRVMSADGRSCDVQFAPGRTALDYVQACGVAGDSAVELAADTAWLVAPDGQVSQVGLASWNANNQPAPEAGAWLWVPGAGLPAALGERIARLLATQGAASNAVALKTLPATQTSTQTAAPRDLPVSANDWGMTGLLQTLTARTPGAGHVGLTATRAWPYTHTTLSFSPFDRLELGFRYTNISNRLYGPTIAGDQSYKDKSSEVKLRVLDESAYVPAVAVGLRDPGGTGLFAGEYVVANKRWGNFDASLGLGWGYLGARGNVRNPLSVLGSRFDTRQGRNVGQGGTANLSSLFTGPAAWFGGVQWHTPVDGLTLKLEVDGNNYAHEPFGNNVGTPRTPVNLGLAWQNGPLTLHAGYERGNRWMVGFSLSTDITTFKQAKRAEPAPWPVVRAPGEAVAAAAPVAAQAAAPLEQALAEQTGWPVRTVRTQPESWTVELDNAQGFSLPQRLDRGMAVVHTMAPEGVRSVRFVLLQQGVPISSRTVDRIAWADSRYAWRGQAPVHASQATPTQASDSSDPYTTRAPGLGLGLGFQQNLGGPDGYLYALSAVADGQWPLWKGAWVQGSVRTRLLDNYSKYSYTAPSALPRVRTLVREYQTSQRVTLPNLQINQLNRWSDSIYTLGYAGALESMYAGVGAEVLWRPLGSRFALGADVNKLAQRDFDQWFALRNYRVTSGHLSAYWDTGWQGVEAKLMVGQYLAGDKGATLEVARRFDNGARMGFWVTKTNVSAAAFGEGSFDKGVFVSIPFDAFLSAWSQQRANVTWQPLIRDGGARLNKAQNLWDITRTRDQREW